jgi:transposase
MSKRYQDNLFLNLNDLVADDHSYRRLDSLISFSKLSASFQSIYSDKGPKGRGVEFGVRALVLQFMEDLSDREMERYLQENNAGKWFCELSLSEQSPDHSYFGDFRKRLGDDVVLSGTCLSKGYGLNTGSIYLC